MEILDVEEDSKDKTIQTQMQATAAHARGREYTFNNPAYANRPLGDWASIWGQHLDRQNIISADKVSGSCLPDPGREESGIWSK